MDYLAGLTDVEAPYPRTKILKALAALAGAFYVSAKKGLARGGLSLPSPAPSPPGPFPLTSFLRRRALGQPRIPPEGSGPGPGPQTTRHPQGHGLENHLKGRHTQYRQLHQRPHQKALFMEGLENRPMGNRDSVSLRAHQRHGRAGRRSAWRKGMVLAVTRRRQRVGEHILPRNRLSG